MVIVLLLDRLNEWFMDKWIEHFKKFNVHIVCGIECCSKEVYEKMVAAGIECYFWGKPWCGADIRNWIIDIVRNKYNPEWIMLTHADEIFEDKIFKEIGRMLDHKEYCWYAFPIYHFWGDFEHYRNDGAWAGGMMDVMRIWKNNVLPIYTFASSGQVNHVQSAPNDMRQLPGIRSNVRVKHFSCANPEAWRAKCFVRGKNWGQVIENEKPELVKWEE